MRRSAAKGFTLIETLVALAIAAVVINGFYSALSTGALLERRADEQARMVLVASTLLDQVGVDIPLRLGNSSGQTDGVTWQLVISNVPAADMQLGTIYENELIFVSVSVTDPTGSAAPVVLRAIRYEDTPL
ncbi:prepilin-type N-terminal cleavage/methylation domain-containing protein [Yoonia maricola]|uniref:Prepilin-type N-terminal cleavage/methylation domain-containing protein n=1 Tax=Yoonia maricola TaxID=420999 RepID=A0A2M8W1X8_9RHOB|nr:prepilin-type N-terminal cleavage/methylation domain-containing protein [Yoonia maricola]PJI84925.1 prepilin-type N-terminal cleavage/methylation domain-containing protein [Yoonia maricola]